MPHVPTTPPLGGCHFSLPNLYIPNKGYIHLTYKIRRCAVTSCTLCCPGINIIQKKKIHEGVSHDVMLCCANATRCEMKGGNRPRPEAVKPFRTGRGCPWMPVLVLPLNGSGGRSTFNSRTMMHMLVLLVLRFFMLISVECHARCHDTV